MLKMNSLIVVEQIFILNHYDWTKIEENIHALIPIEIHRKRVFSGKLEFTLFLTRACERGYFSMLKINFLIVVE